MSLFYAFRYPGILLHRPAGFGKTTFLKELAQFCDAFPDSNSRYNDQTPKYFTSEHIKNSYVALHEAKYLMLHFDLGNLLPEDSDTFTEAGFRDRVLSEIRGSLGKYISKYAENGSLFPPPFEDYSTVPLMDICHLLPVGFVLLLSDNILVLPTTTAVPVRSSNLYNC